MRARMVCATLRLQASLTAPSSVCWHMLVLPAWCASLLLHEVKLRKISRRLHAEPSGLASASAATMSNSSTMSYSFFLNALRWPRALLLDLQCTCFLPSLAEHVHDKEVRLVIASASIAPCCSGLLLGLMCRLLRGIRTLRSRLG